MKRGGGGVKYKQTSAICLHHLTSIHRFLSYQYNNDLLHLSKLVVVFIIYQIREKIR